MLKEFKNKICSVVSTVKATATCKKAEGYVDSGVKILIAVVIGALLLTGLYALLYNILGFDLYEGIMRIYFYQG